MTTAPASQCAFCANLTAAGDGDTPPRCRAFPDGIPDAVYFMELDHRQPVEGDHGIQWEPLPGDEYPEYALQRST